LIYYVKTFQARWNLQYLFFSLIYEIMDFHFMDNDCDRRIANERIFDFILYDEK